MTRAKNRSEGQWSELIREWKGSGQSQTAFCRNRGCSVSAFSKRRREQGDKPVATAARFTEVQVRGALPQASEGRLEVRLVNGSRVSVEGAVDPLLLSAVLRELGGC